MEEEFTDIYRQNRWGCPETVSGPGSALDACSSILERLPGWIGTLGIRSVVDLGCGDFHWASKVDMGITDYDGYDIVEPLIEKNRALHGKPNIRFHHRNIMDMMIPQADLVVVKDVLIHLPNCLGVELLEKIKTSGSLWLAATTSPGWEAKTRLGMFVGGFSPTDLEQAPYSLGTPQEVLKVPHRADLPEKFLALWKLRDSSMSPEASAEQPHP